METAPHRAASPPSAAMRLHISDPRETRDLVRFFRRREYLAVEHERGILEVVPINSLTDRAERLRTLHDLAEWKAAYPGVEAEPLEG